MKKWMVAFVLTSAVTFGSYWLFAKSQAKMTGCSFSDLNIKWVVPHLGYQWATEESGWMSYQKGILQDDLHWVVSRAVSEEFIRRGSRYSSGGYTFVVSAFWSEEIPAFRIVLHSHEVGALEVDVLTGTPDIPDNPLVPASKRQQEFIRRAVEVAAEKACHELSKPDSE